MNRTSRKLVRSRRSRLGITLLEMIVSLVSAGILVGGLASSIALSIRATDQTLMPTRDVLLGQSVVTDMATQMQFAEQITESAASKVTVVVPDRDADGLSETIRFAWSGNPGDPVTRTYNGGTPQTLIDGVTQFQLDYTTDGSRTLYITVRIQVRSDDRAQVVSSIPLDNQP